MTDTVLTDSELENILGPVGIRDFRGASKEAQGRIREWAATLGGLSDEDLVTESVSLIIDSAIAERFPRMNWSETDCKTTGVYQEAKRRHVAAGHAEDCRGDSLYTESHNRALTSQGHEAAESNPCTCKEGQ